MNLRKSFVALSTAILFAACSSEDAVGPMKAPTRVNLAVVSGAAPGSYVVVLKGNNVAAFTDKVATLGGAVAYLHQKAGFAVVSGLSDGAVAQLRASSAVADIQPDQVVSLESPLFAADATLEGNPTIESQANPTTGLRYAWQWNMRAIHAPAAWAAGKLGDPSVKVAILDTGIDYDSFDATGLVDSNNSTSFMNVYVRNTQSADTLLTDAQVAARADNLIRSTYFPNRAEYTDFNGHGTNVASQVSSKAFALAGVTSRTTLMAVKVLGSNGSGSLSTVLMGVLYAADHGADVANMSLGGAFQKSGNGRFVGIINKVFNYAKQAGMLIVVAAGNSGIDLQHDGNLYVNYCDAPHVLCVSAVGLPTFTAYTAPDFYTNAATHAFYTNYGKNSIGVAAPGGNASFNSAGAIQVTTWPWGNDIASWVWSFCAKDRIGSFTAANVPLTTACASGFRLSGLVGTSQASPHVAGLAALLVAEYGKGIPMTIKKLIQNSGDPMDADLNGAYGNTVINVQRALGL